MLNVGAGMRDVTTLGFGELGWHNFERNLRVCGKLA